MHSISFICSEVNFLKLKYPLDECKLITKKSTEYQEEIAYILDHEARNKLLIKLAMNQKKNTLMLFQFVDRHGKKLLADMNAQSDKHLKKVFFIYQKVSGDERELIRKTLDGADPVWYDFEFENGAMMRFKDYEKINLYDCCYIRNAWLQHDSNVVELSLFKLCTKYRRRF